MKRLYPLLLVLGFLSVSGMGHAASPPAGDALPLIVIDPGHGGADLGATGVTGIFEKDVVLDFARSLKKRLEMLGTCRVILTRDRDVFLSLEDRVRFAKKQNASVFLSIHADTITAATDIRGVTVYTGDDRASDAEAARVAEAENRADAGLTAPESKVDSSVNDILGDLMLRETRAHSILLAQELASRIADVVQLNRNPVRAAGFRVLRAPDIPSILIEIGYLSSKSDIDLLTSADWRDSTALRLAAGISEFIARTRANNSKSTP
jgi:N-acetylmuramoyl-L-alanine amidase